MDGDLVAPRLPVVPGHQIAGEVIEVGAGVDRARLGQRVGIPWLGWTCGACEQCRAGRENLCARARFTGLHRDGGYAELCAADAGWCVPLPDGITDERVAPLLCAGLIGWRALRLAGEGERLGIYGFGSAAVLLAQVARFQGRRVFAFTRPGDTARQQAARGLGAAWAGGSDQRPPEELDTAILFAAAGELVPLALGAVRRGGVVVCGEIHMSDIPTFPYSLLWGERVLRSVANLTRRDAEDYLPLAARIPVVTRVSPFPLAEAPAALDAVRRGRIEGAAVLIPREAR